MPGPRELSSCAAFPRWVRGRSLYHALARRGLAAGAALLLAACSDPDADPGALEQAPAMDRESWDVEVVLHQAGRVARIRAPYVADYLDAGVTRMDSGAVGVFTGRAGEAACVVRADRLALDHRGGQVRWGGGVRVARGDRLILDADSLVWWRDQDRLAVPGTVHLRLLSGWQTGQGLVTDTDLSQWRMEAVRGRWRAAAHGEDSLTVEAAVARGDRGPGDRIVYQAFTVSLDRVFLGAEQAVLDEAAGRLILTGKVRGREDGRRWHAGRARLDLDGGWIRMEQAVRLEGGSRSGREPFTVCADSARWERDRGLFRLWGRPVAFGQDSLNITCQALVYGDSTGSVWAAGGVRYGDGSAALTADSLCYEREGGRVEAWGDAVVEGRGWKGILKAERVFLEEDSETARFRGNPRLEQAEEDGNGWTLEAEQMEVAWDARCLQARDSVRVHSGDLRLRAEQGTYEETAGRLRMRGAVELVEQGSGRPAYRFRADSMEVAWKGGWVERVRLMGGLWGRFRSAEGRTDWIQGKRGTVFLEKGTLQRLALDEPAKGVHRDSLRREITAFQGAALEMEFSEGVPERAWVRGEAESITRRVFPGREDRPAVNRVRGAALEIHFDPAGIQVRVGPKAEGRYRPAQSE